MKTDEFMQKFKAAFPDGDVRFIGFTGADDTMRGTAEVSLDEEHPERVLISLWYDDDYGTAFLIDPRTAVELPNQWEVNARGQRWAIRPGDPSRRN